LDQITLCEEHVIELNRVVQFSKERNPGKKKVLQRKGEAKRSGRSRNSPIFGIVMLSNRPGIVRVENKYFTYPRFTQEGETLSPILTRRLVGDRADSKETLPEEERIGAEISPKRDRDDLGPSYGARTSGLKRKQ